MATAKGLRSLAQPSLDWRRASEQLPAGEAAVAGGIVAGG